MELLNFYSFFSIPDPPALGKDCCALAQELELKGTILLAPEGMNLALSGKSSALDIFLKEKTAPYTALDPARLRRAAVQEPAYRRLRLKIKAEIINSSFGLTLKENKRNEDTYIEPQKFHAWAQNKDICLLDIRNDYEFKIGTFRNALRLPLNEFSQLPMLFEYLEAYRKQDIVTFCTGGVRCEKAVPLLKKKGFRAFQLHGGILHYLEKHANRQDSLWQGECFVFDERVALNAKLEKGSYEWCKRCGQPSQSGVCVICGSAVRTRSQNRVHGCTRFWTEQKLRDGA